MDRIPDVNMEELDRLIAEEQAQANTEIWGDWDLNEKIDEQGYPTENPSGILVDRRTRPNVSYYLDSESGAWLPSRLKYNDHVRILNAFDGVVAMAARDRRFFLIYAPETYGNTSLVALDAAGVTDRAPLDPEEEPMPINAPPPAPEPPPEGTVTIATTLTSHAHAATITTTIDDEGIHTEVEGAS